MDSPDAPGSYDVAYCLSVVEHIPTAVQRRRMMTGVHRLLRRGGLFVRTIDLALTLYPFTTTPGAPELQNVAIDELLSFADFSLVFGNPSELIGMPGFDPAVILRRAAAGDFLLDGNGLTSQCLVLQAR